MLPRNSFSKLSRLLRYDLLASTSHAILRFVILELGCYILLLCWLAPCHTLPIGGTKGRPEGFLVTAAAAALLSWQQHFAQHQSAVFPAFTESALLYPSDFNTSCAESLPQRLWVFALQSPFFELLKQGEECFLLRGRDPSSQLILSSSAPALTSSALLWEVYPSVLQDLPCTLLTRDNLNFFPSPQP